MRHVTLRQGIESAIQASVPEITQIIDTTDHGGKNRDYQPSKRTSALVTGVQTAAGEWTPRPTDAHPAVGLEAHAAVPGRRKRRREDGWRGAVWRDAHETVHRDACPSAFVSVPLGRKGRHGACPAPALRTQPAAASR